MTATTTTPYKDLIADLFGLAIIYERARLAKNRAKAKRRAKRINARLLAANNRKHAIKF